MSKVSGSVGASAFCIILIRFFVFYSQNACPINEHMMLNFPFSSDVTNAANGERGPGNRERESGTKCTAATLLRIQNGGQNTRKGSKRNNLG